MSTGKCTELAPYTRRLRTFLHRFVDSQKMFCSQGLHVNMALSRHQTLVPFWKHHSQLRMRMVGYCLQTARLCTWRRHKCSSQLSQLDLINAAWCGRLIVGLQANCSEKHHPALLVADGTLTGTAWVAQLSGTGASKFFCRMSLLTCSAVNPFSINSKAVVTWYWREVIMIFPSGNKGLVTKRQVLRDSVIKACWCVYVHLGVDTIRQWRNYVNITYRRSQFSERYRFGTPETTCLGLMHCCTCLVPQVIV